MLCKRESNRFTYWKFGYSTDFNKNYGNILISSLSCHKKKIIWTVVGYSNLVHQLKQLLALLITEELKNSQREQINILKNWIWVLPAKHSSINTSTNRLKLAITVEGSRWKKILSFANGKNILSLQKVKVYLYRQKNIIIPKISNEKGCIA